MRLRSGGAAYGLKPWQVLVQHLPIKKEKCVRRLSVGGQRNLAFIGQHGQESFELCFTHVAQMPHFADPPVPPDEESDPMQASFFGLQAIVKYRIRAIGLPVLATKGKTMPNELKCVKCTADMKQGYVLEYGDGNVGSASKWIAGPPEKSFLFGVNVKDREQYPIESFRCVRCGYLESYARTPPSGAA